MMPLVSSMFTTTQIADERYAICKQCPNLNFLNMCKVCGCIVPVKIRFRQMECPMEKWLAVEDDGQLHFVDDQRWEQLERDDQATKTIGKLP